MNRRSFLTLMGAGVATTAFAASFRRFYSNLAQGSPIQAKGFGKLIRDPQGILDLPQGFNYRVISKLGNQMSDNTRIPTCFDGMATFKGKNDTTILIRNHELSPYDITEITAADNKKFDPLSKGGTTTIILDKNNQILQEFVSLAGTNRNCAGGVTPWGSWISCEEDVSTPQDYPLSDPRAVKRKHGYNFEVPALGNLADPVPLVSMGRFRHEAIAVDPQTGIIYQTEDQTDGCFYRFIPKVREKLREGGTLQALVIDNSPRLHTGTNLAVDQEVSVKWVNIDTVDPDDDTLRYEAQEKGAAIFSRGEGIIWAKDGVYWTCTNGGKAGLGQIFRYQPQTNILTLFAESPSQEVLDYPDNLTLSPFGDFILCEDGKGEQFLRGLTPEGKIYPFARNALNNSEFAGVCFSPDGKTMFVNIYQPGLTLAIQGNFSRI